MLWKITVAEKRAVEMLYLVSADTQAEAIEKAERGETVEETFVRDGDVVGREILDGPEEEESK